MLLAQFVDDRLRKAFFLGSVEGGQVFSLRKLVLVKVIDKDIIDSKLCLVHRVIKVDQYVEELFEVGEPDSVDVLRCGSGLIQVK